MLSADYQRILKVLADRVRLHQGPLTCQEMAAAFGMDVVPARVEALRSKAKRLVARGWLTEPAPGRFAGVTGHKGYRRRWSGADGSGAGFNKAACTSVSWRGRPHRAAPPTSSQSAARMSHRWVHQRAA